MKKLMIVGLVAACACTSQAGLFSSLASALTGKASGVAVTSSSAKTIDVETVDLMELNEKEFDTVLEKANTKALRRTLVGRFLDIVEKWNPPKLLKPVKSAAVKILEGLQHIEIQTDKIWKRDIAPALKKAWNSVREFFGKIGK